MVDTPQRIFRARRFVCSQNIDCPKCGKVLSIHIVVNDEKKSLTVIAHSDPLCQSAIDYSLPAFAALVWEVLDKTWQVPNG